MKLGRALRTLRSDLEASGEPVLTFDIGDCLDRVRPETEATFGQVNAALLEALGYDGWVFGNNEGLTIPAEYWPKLAKRSGTLVFGTNLRQSGGSRVPGFVDEHVYVCGGLRIGVFGLTPKYDKPYEHLCGMALPPFECAAKAVARLREQGCQIVVVLSHLGVWDDRKLAVEVKGIDVILGGHSHTFMEEPEWVAETAVFHAGKFGFAFGHTCIHYDEQHRKVVSVDAECIPVSVHQPPDGAMLSAYRGYLPDAQAFLDQSVVTLDESLPVCFTQESAFPNALADALYAAYPCDFAVMMSGALNASLLAGQVTRGHVHAACSTPTRPLLMTLSGKDIFTVIQTSLRPDVVEHVGRGYGFRGSVVGYLALSHAEVQVAVNEHGAREVVSLRIGGDEVEPDREYRVATCEFLWLSSLYQQFRDGSDIDIRPPLVRDVLVEYMSNPSAFALAKQVRYHVVTNLS